MRLPPKASKALEAMDRMSRAMPLMTALSGGQIPGQAFKAFIDRMVGLSLLASQEILRNCEREESAEYVNARLRMAEEALQELDKAQQSFDTFIKGLGG